MRISDDDLFIAWKAASPWAKFDSSDPAVKLRMEGFFEACRLKNDGEEMLKETLKSYDELVRHWMDKACDLEEKYGNAQNKMLHESSLRILLGILAKSESSPTSQEVQTALKLAKELHASLNNIQEGEE